MLTVLMATRNGGRTLGPVLECFTRLQAPSSGWKLVVIDNGSTDNTRQIIESFIAVLPLMYVFEGTPGKNAALNSGLSHVEGDLVIFTDDDVFPRKDWLVQLREAADKHESFSMFGGAITPRWEVPPAPWVAWLPPAPIFTVTDPGMTDGFIDAGLIYGPNMAIRTAIFDAGTRFDPSIGPKGSEYPMGSESELLERLMRQGHKAWHVHEAVVEHLIRDYQIDQSWVLRRGIRFGRGQLRLLRASDPKAASHWFGVPPRFFLRMIKRLLRIAVAWVMSDERGLLIARWELNYLWGHVVEAWNLRGQNRLPDRRLQSATREA